ncbi:MAG: alpha/beta hydrolase [Gemmatimonadota bacterium]|nr:alpha/beta hydrolase [Gemmatimonadota bacterium]
MVAFALLAAAAASAQAPRLYYEMDGEGTHLVLIEEGGHDTSSWFLLLPDLRERHRVIRYDLRGQGRSEPAADGEYSPAAHRRDLERILDGLDVGSAHLVGVGRGARIAIEAARARPDRVRSLVLIQPRLEDSADEHAWWSRLAVAWERVGEPSFGEYSSVLVQRWIGSRFATLHPWVPPFYDLMLRRQDAAPLAASLRGWLLAEPPDAGVIRGVPTLVAVGEDGRSPSASLARTVATASRVRIEDSRWPIVDAPRELVDALTRFLAGVDERRPAP